MIFWVPQSQGSIESNTAGTAEASHSISNEATVDSRVTACKNLLDDLRLPLAGTATAPAEFPKELGLKTLNLKFIEAIDYYIEE
jgi:hypothetical protein